MTLDQGREPGPIPDHLAPDLDILFVGFNPSLRSGLTGHHYANPSNRFWKVLFEAGLTSRIYKPEEDGELLRLGYGFTNIVDRPTRRADEITNDEFREGRRKLKQKIETFRPKIVCFVGKGVYEQYSGKSEIPWGVQPEPQVPGVVDFVAPSTSGLVRMRTAEIVSIFSNVAPVVGEGAQRKWSGPYR